MSPAEALRLRRQKKEEIKRQKNRIYKARYKAKKKAKEAELAAQNPAPIIVKVETEPKILTKEEKRKEYRKLWARNKRAREKLKRQLVEARKEENRIHKQLQCQLEVSEQEDWLQEDRCTTITQTEWLGKIIQAEGQSDDSLSDSGILSIEKPLKLMTGSERAKYYRERRRAKTKKIKRASYDKIKLKRKQEKAEREKERTDREKDLPKGEVTKEEKRREYKRLWIQKKRAEQKLQKQKIEGRKEKNRIYKRLQRQRGKLDQEAFLQETSFTTMTQAEWLGENIQAEGQSDEGLSGSDILGVKEEEFEAKLESVSISFDLGANVSPESPTPLIKEEIVDDTFSS